MRRLGCTRADHPRLGRRELLQVGGLSLLGAGLSDLLRLEAQAAPAPRRKNARAVIFIFQSGGPSQHETFDPKPDAPDGVRGEYGTTATRLPGVRFCEYLPRLAARADRFAVVRTLHHQAERQFRNEHNSCTYLLHTGRAAMPPGDTNASIWGDVFPCFLAGGGVRGGQAVGQTDRHGGLPVTEPYTPADLAATAFHLLGVGPGAEFHDAQGRPYRLTEGKPIPVT
jgi:hypothetical protein